MPSFSLTSKKAVCRMPLSARLSARLLLTLFVVLTVAACNAIQLSPAPVTSRSAGQSQAEQLETQGDFVGAAELYLRLADAANPRQRQGYQLSAASASLRAGDIVQARRIIAELDAKGLDANQRARMQLLDAEIALSEGNPQQTLQALDNFTQPNLAPGLQAQSHLLRAEAYVLLNDHLTSARERVALESLLSDPVAVRDNQNAIVQSLAMLPDPVLQQAGGHPPEVLSGWVDLVQIARLSNQDSAQFNQRIVDWQQRYRQHPASAELIAALPTLGRGTPQGAAPLAQAGGAPINYPQRIALLLPMSGSLASVGNALSAAFLAAASAQQAGNAKPDIRAYDVAAGSADVEAAKVLQVYQQAVQEGAEFVVGPLQKNAVKALFTLGAAAGAYPGAELQ